MPNPDLSMPMHPAGVTVTDPDIIKIVEAYRSLPEAWRPGFIRCGIRLLNNDPKVRRLMEMRDRGQISEAQFFSMM